MRFKGHWRRFWFPPLSSRAFAAYQTTFCAALLLMITFRSRAPLWSWSEVDEAFWLPIPLTELLALDPPPEQVLFVVDLLFKLSLTMACLGLWRRWSSIAALVTGAAYFWLPHNFGKVHHGDALLLFFLLLFALPPAARGFSLSRWIQFGRRRQVSSRPAAPEFYGAVLRIMQALMVLVFFGAGIAKLRAAGLDWALSDNLRNLLMRHVISHEPVSGFGTWLAHEPILYQSGAVMALALEVGAPLMLFHRSLRIFFAVGLFSLQVANWFVLGVPFALFMCCYLCWAPWEAAARQLQTTCGVLRRGC